MAERKSPSCGTGVLKLKEFSSGLRAREIREIHAFRDAERLTAQEPGTPMQTEEPTVKQDRVCGKEKRPENSF